ncbi:hypothetical protein MLD38_016882 [Melastoma candidum]|uniref:Uncharacterized protein n=1 Tax=Melastoma candidum TaxID=119954 RepID=A0ACB9QP04_9MYRT|nr:hypothetical protein MLD38_016882 [Melastoma candidum]
MDYSVLTGLGYYSYLLDRENQDSCCIKTLLQGNPNFHFFSVLDGHGLLGNQCSNFVKDWLVEKLGSDPALDLSYDQTPSRRDEYEMSKLYSVRVLSVDQVEGLKDPDIQTWGDKETEGNDPPRLWVQALKILLGYGRSLKQHFEE